MPPGRPGWSLSATPGAVLRGVGITPQKLAAAAYQAGEELRTEWVRTLSGPGRGRLYEMGINFITWNGRVIPIKDKSGVRRRARVKLMNDDGNVSRGRHRASAPGDAPATDRGTLKGTIAAVPQADGSTRVGSNSRILLAQEYGVGVTGSKVAPHPGGIEIKPRPSARRSYRAARERMTQRVRAVLRAQ